MSIINTELFPFPHYKNGLQVDGSIMAWPDRCKECPLNACQNDKSKEIRICSYGYNYLRATDSIIVGGIVLKDFSSTNSARKKVIRKHKDNLISEEHLLRSVNVLRTADDAVEKEIQKKKEKILKKYLREKQYEQDFLTPLREDIQKGLSFVHDYKQINTAIRQNINVIIEKRYSGDDIEAKVLKADVEERSIYEASRFLDEKLNVAKFLLHPEWLREQGQCVKFKFHGVLMKYRHIYTPAFKSKKLKVTVIGKSYLEMMANPQAVQVIPHTFIDNAVKYSPRLQRIEIHVQDNNESINFSVSSYGPVIGVKDSEKIFGPFFRTKSAEAMVEEGAGYGLYISQTIAVNHLDTKIIMSQDRNNCMNNCYWTTFSVDLPLKASIL